MIQSILIANRGEIASRIIKTCRRLGIHSIAVYADPDQYLPFVEEADEAIALGGNTASESYLVQDKIIAAAKRTQASAIHPGFGFLSENAAFAQRCQQEGIVFIGPKPSAIDSMGLKSTAKTIMDQNGIPTIPGYQGEDQSLTTLIQEANAIGYPILIKAVAGGGGKGMRIVQHEHEIKIALEAVQREAFNSFGNKAVLLERYFVGARHIEFQIFGDQHGNVIHLLERECSIQRRYQKIIEESPSPSLSDELRHQMGQAAIAAAKAIHYDNAGTVEFIVTPQGEFFFLEVNTRLQVEHPVTEMITGLDLVEWQILVAEGQPLPLKQAEIQSNGYAMECRLYAEDASNNFFPSTGTVLHWETTPIEGLRYESGVRTGSEIGIYYDPMLAKIIAHAPNRLAAIRKMNYALRQLKCIGPITNQPFLVALLQHEAIQTGDYHTNFIAQAFDFKNFALEQKKGAVIAAIASLLYRWQQRQDERQLIPALPSAWRNNYYQASQESYLVNGETIQLNYRYKNKVFSIQTKEQNYQVELLYKQQQALGIKINDQHHNLSCYNNGDQYYIHHQAYGQIQLNLCPRFPDLETAKTKNGYKAPMPSEVLKINVQIGQQVKEGQALITLLSMKMENTISAQEDGWVEDIFVTEGNAIPKGIVLLKIKVL
ncbi:acetyl/propionyl/methylcrotonyl-CoA carboxylase subunit alpha [Aureispira anguillae]|uniref:ATP-grasp domain-containing protein n=1 Tax=Aureispira anguillae TaxID=2864201 RepID=A0A915YFM1_9BACT|nr:biotin carboxylase N-terminal domain-containing protein [Aureispira anguillae]BDS12257.1 ATP-grasp domain-containing protein [Aureispira anguillae]